MGMADQGSVENDILSKSARQHANTLNDSLEIFIERNGIRKDLWARYGAEAHLAMAREKMLRVEINLEDGAPNIDVAIDDALDCINFMAFVVRRLRGDVPDE